METDNNLTASQLEDLTRILYIYNNNPEFAKLLTGNDAAVTVVLGPENSGKSSAINQLLGKQLVPTSYGTTTKVPLMITIAGKGNEPFVLSENGKSVVTSDDPSKVYDYIDSRDTLIQTPVYNRLRNLLVHVDAFPTVICDLPGFLVGANAKHQENFCVSPQKGYKTSLLICVVNAGACFFNPRSDGNVGNIIEIARKHRMKLMIVVNHCDVLLERKQANAAETLIKNIYSLKNDMKEQYNFEFAVVLVKCTSTQGFNYELTRKEEKQIWEEFPILKEALDSDGKPLFHLGFEHIRGVIFSGPLSCATTESFLAAEDKVSEQIAVLKAKLTQGSEFITPVSKQPIIVPALMKSPAVTACQSEFQSTVHKYLIDICTSLFARRARPEFKTQQAQNGPSSGPSYVNEDDNRQQNVLTYRSEVEVYIREICISSGGIFEKAIESLKKHTLPVFNGYAHHRAFHGWLLAELDKYVSEKRSSLVPILKLRIEEHFNIVDVVDLSDLTTIWKDKNLIEAAKSNPVIKKLFGSLATIIGHILFNISFMISTALFANFPESLSHRMIDYKGEVLSELSKAECEEIQKMLAVWEGALEALRRFRSKWVPIRQPEKSKKRTNEEPEDVNPQKKLDSRSETENGQQTVSWFGGFLSSMKQ